MWKDSAELLTKTESIDAGGNLSYTTVPKTIFCNIKSVKYNEFYVASSNGFKPEIVLVCRLTDYSGESLVKYNGIDYTVIRTYNIGDNVELTLTTGGVRNGS